jgi:hypothetical protein
MNKYLKLHIDQASHSTRRRYRIATVIAKLAWYIGLSYAFVLSIWWCMTVVFAMTPGM